MEAYYKKYGVRISYSKIANIVFKLGSDKIEKHLGITL